ncbi:MAG: WYL domain-containing protein [Actinomycetota bacterium]|nr:WYL domain-containing protein [Actinomycetota bacterium]
MIDRLERLVNLVIALRETRRPMTADEIHERVAGYDQETHEAFRRTFERDKADLRALGVPVATAPVDRWDDAQGYRIDPRRYDLPSVALSGSELTALALALQVTGLVDEAAAGLRKLEVDADEPAAERLTPAPPVGVDLSHPVSATLLEAQLSRTVVRFDYSPLEGRTARRTVDPHAVVHRRGRWYLVGRDHERRGRRVFRLDRIRGRVTTVGEPGAFEPPPEGVGVDDVLPQPPPDAPPDAEVDAAPSVAWLVARRARGAGRPAPGGWTRYSLPVGDPDRFVGWVLEYGPELRVIRPASLRRRVRQQLRSLAHGQPEVED